MSATDMLIPVAGHDKQDWHGPRLSASGVCTSHFLLQTRSAPVVQQEGKLARHCAEPLVCYRCRSSRCSAATG